MLYIRLPIALKHGIWLISFLSSSFLGDWTEDGLKCGAKGTLTAFAFDIPNLDKTLAK